MCYMFVFARSKLCASFVQAKGASYVHNYVQATFMCCWVFVSKSCASILLYMYICMRPQYLRPTYL